MATQGVADQGTIIRPPIVVLLQSQQLLTKAFTITTFRRAGFALYLEKSESLAWVHGGLNNVGPRERIGERVEMFLMKPSGFW